MVIQTAAGNKVNVIVSRFLYAERVGNNYRMEFKCWIKRASEWEFVSEEVYRQIMAELSKPSHC